MNTSQIVIENTNLSDAWRTAMERIIKSPGKELTPLLLTLTDFEESGNTREVLDSYLLRDKKGSIQTVSETIFPNSLYKFCDYDRLALYDEYLKNVPRLKKIDSSNSHGTYFERLIAYDKGDRKINQLEIIISSLKSKTIKRRSKLQASIFDPGQDHTNRPFQGFPCLQHVTFLESEKGGLVLNSFYAIQYLYRRAYGNWLGLINLGKFISNELDMEFERFNCYIGVEHLDELTKNQAQKLLKKTE
jgi:thymidylate synthase